MWTTTFDGTNYAQGAAIGILMLVSVAVLVIPYLVAEYAHGDRDYEPPDQPSIYFSTCS